MNDVTPPHKPNTLTPSLRFDVERYRPHLVGNNLSREEEDILLTAAWDFVVRFVDIGFGLNRETRR